MQGLLNDLPKLLNTSVGAAAVVLRELTGPIPVHQVTLPGHKRPQWVAQVRADPVLLLVRQARERRCPSASTLEFLQIRGWTMPVEACLLLTYVPKYQVRARQVQRLADQGLTLKQIAAELAVPYLLAEDALRFACHGRHPVWRAK